MERYTVLIPIRHLNTDNGELEFTTFLKKPVIIKEEGLNDF